MFSNAIQTIFESQLASGAWPLASNSIEGDIITTCLGIYAVVAAKPKNWLESAQKAKSWLLSQINEVGCWHIEGSPTTYINTFCLEAILMINEPDKASFTVPEKSFTFGGLPGGSKIEEVNIIVFCEGSLDDGPLYQFDAECYSRIFINEFPNVKFLSIGNCHDVINDSNQIIKSITRLLPTSRIIKLIDRDNRSESEIQELRSKDPSVKVLDLRSIENYILDDEVIRKFCSMNGNSGKFDEVIEAKHQAIQESITRNNPSDDIKSASGSYYNSIKRILNLTKSGNNGYGFMLYSLVPLITNDLDVYSRLKENIFESN